jgi:hypothetical protein
VEQQNAPTAEAANTPKLIAAWIFVGIPFAWGVFKTVGNALALFK